LLDGRADAGTIGSPFWNAVRTERLVPEGALTEIWTSPPFNHCMFTARSDLDRSLEQQFAKALFGMSYDNPAHRPVLEAEGLHQWIAPQLAAYAELRNASAQQGFLKQPSA
jgi:ABC-type phosphate/phosphonate transport system substrate-binding protein